MASSKLANENLTDGMGVDNLAKQDEESKVSKEESLNHENDSKV